MSGLIFTCPACGKRQRVARRGSGKVQCGHCRTRIDLPEETPVTEPETASLRERVEALEKLAGRLEAEVAELRSGRPLAPAEAPIKADKRLPTSFPARLTKCRHGRLTIHFAQEQAGASEHAVRVCRLFGEQKWEVAGPLPSPTIRAGTTFAVGSLPMSPALADLYMALGAAGVEVVSVLDQNLGADEACLTITNETALLVAGRESGGDSVRAA